MQEEASTSKRSYFFNLFFSHFSSLLWVVNNVRKQLRPQTFNRALDVLEGRNGEPGLENEKGTCDFLKIIFKMHQFLEQTETRQFVEGKVWINTSLEPLAAVFNIAFICDLIAASLYWFVLFSLHSRGKAGAEILTSLRRAFSLYRSKASECTGWRRSASTSVCGPGRLQFSQRQP